MCSSFREETRAVSQLAAIGMVLGTALVLAIALGVLMLAGPAP